MALSRDIVIRLQGDADSAIKAQKAAADAAGVSVTAYRKAEREYDRQQKAMETASRKQRKAMEEVGRASVIAGGAIVAGLGMAVKAAINWESAWTGVLKTVNGTDAELANLEQGLRGLTRVLPASHEEIAAVAEAAGQLGVQTDNIVDFTRVMINLGETTNLSADEAATSLAQLMNVMQTAPDDVDRLGSTLVALGNAGASTEADIVKMASYITGSARLIGASESDVLALANAMTSMGINAERGGGVMTRVMQDIYAAVQTGGDHLQGFADVAGVSAQEFADQFRADPIAAIDSFVQGLNTVEENGGNVVSTLGDLGYVGTQDTAVLLQLKGAGDLLTDSLDLGNQAWEQNTALIKEAAKRYDTTAAKTEMARNAINDAAIDIGDVFLPVLASLAETVADVAGWFADLPGPIQAVIGSLSGVAGVGALVGGAFLLMAPRVMETYRAFQLLKTSSPGVAAGLGKLGQAAQVAGAVALLGTAVHSLDEAMAPAPATMEKWVDALLAADGSLASIDAQFDALDKGLGGWTDIDNFGDAVRRLTDPTNTERLNDFGGSLFNVLSLGTSDTGEGAASRRRSLEAIQGLDQALALMVSQGNADLAAEKFAMLTAEAERQGVSVEDLNELFPEYQSGLDGLDNDQKAAAESARIQAEQTRLLAQDADVAYGSLQGYAEALGLSEEATQDLIDKSNELGESLGLFIDPLGAYTGLLQEKAQAEADAANKLAETTGAQTTSWEDYVDSVDVSFEEYLALLEQQVADQTNWQTNMLMLAGRVSQGTLDELARMGPEGAPLVADLVNASDAELSRFDDVTAKRAKEATDAWGQQLTLATPVLAQVAKIAGQGVVNSLAAQLQAGTITVAQIAERYGINLAGGINPVLNALGRPSIKYTAGSYGPNGYNSGGGYWAGGYTGPGGRLQPAGIVHAGEVVWSQEDVAAHGGPGRVEAMRRSRMGYAGGGYVSTSSVPHPPSTAPFRPPISTAADATMGREYDEVIKWLEANLAPPSAGFGAAPGVASGSNQAIVQALAAQMYGWVGSQWDALYALIMKESGFRNTAQNPTSTAYGMFQFLDSTWAGYGVGKTSDPRLQTIAGLRYIASRYGSPSAALGFHLAHNWYDSGGWLEPGLTMAYNGTGRRERVLDADQSRQWAVGGGGRGGAIDVDVNIVGAQITGEFHIGGDGIARLVKGSVVTAFVEVLNRGRYNG